MDNTTYVKVDSLQNKKFGKAKAYRLIQYQNIVAEQDPVRGEQRFNYAYLLYVWSNG